MRGELPPDGAGRGHERQYTETASPTSIKAATVQCRRRYQRVPFLCPVELTALPEGRTFPARSLDISLGGVGVLSQIGLEREHLVSVAFLLGNGAQGRISERVMGRVAGLRADDTGNVIGIEFVEPLSTDKHPALLRKLQSL